MSRQRKEKTQKSDQTLYTNSIQRHFKTTDVIAMKMAS